MVIYFKKNKELVEMQRIYPVYNENGRMIQIRGISLNKNCSIVDRALYVRNLEPGENVNDEKFFDFVEQIWDFILEKMLDGNHSVTIDGWYNTI